MTNMEIRIRELKEACANPRARMEYYLKQGKKIVGCFPPYTPEELVHASGMIPFGCWGAQKEVKLAKKYLPAFACSVLQTNLELGLLGAYRGMSAMIIPTLCDTLRCISQDWRYGVKEIPMIPITYPQNRTLSAAEDFLISEFETVLSRLSILTGNMLNDETLEHTIDVYNEHSEMMRRFDQAAYAHPDVITPSVRHAVMKSAFFYEKSEHTEIVREMTEELEKLPDGSFQGKKVILSGILAEPDELLDILQENGIAVAGDDLAQESRQYRTLIPAEGTTPLHRLAKQWINRRGCSLIHEEDKQRGDILARMSEERGADGVIYCLMKFCDPEEYDYPVCRKKLNEKEIPVLLLEIDQLTAGGGQISTRIQTFKEML